MVPDPSSLRQLPWHPAHSVALCDYQDGAFSTAVCRRCTASRAALRCAGQGKPHELCCRGALRRQVEHLREQGLSLRVGAGVYCSRPLASAVGPENSDRAEMEFVLCKQTRNGDHTSFELDWGEVHAPFSEDLLNLASPGTASRPPSHGRGQHRQLCVCRSAGRHDVQPGAAGHLGRGYARRVQPRPI